MAHDPGEELHTQRRMDEKILLYTQFLSDRGWVWSSEVEVREVGDFRPQLAQMEISQLAALRLMLEEAARHRNVKIEAVEGLHQIRKMVIGSLWSIGLWDEPWISLINQELPGTEPTAEDYDSFAQLSRAKARTYEISQQAFYALLSDMEATLVDNGYVPESEDSKVLAALVSSLLLEELQRERRSDQLLNSRLNAMKLIGGAANPQHSAWRQLLDQFFPIPSEI